MTTPARKATKARTPAPKKVAPPPPFELPGSTECYRRAGELLDDLGTRRYSSVGDGDIEAALHLANAWVRLGQTLAGHAQGLLS